LGQDAIANRIDPVKIGDGQTVFLHLKHYPDRHSKKDRKAKRIARLQEVCGWIA
jgi:hypothetical protein